MKITKLKRYIYQIEKEGEMLVPGIIYISENLFDEKNTDVLKQVVNVAKLPGIIKHSLAMPDMHQGYGFCIGGVAAFDLEEGVICPGGVGFDINCGVRLMSTEISKEEFLKYRKDVLEEIYNEIPTGVGFENKKRLTIEQLDKYMINGALEAVKNNYGTKDDLINCEENGMVANTDTKLISQRAKARGLPQLGTLGSGNHFIEFQVVDKIFNEEIANKIGVKKDNVYIMIHTGSRGLGHQIASDYIKKMEETNPNKDDRQLSYVKIKSKLGQEYLKSMNCAVNFAFANRQIIMHKIRLILKKYFPENKSELISDVCHNIAKIEEHIIDGKSQKVCIHRKGATRAKQGEVLIIPGSMGTSSYVLVGGEKSEELSFQTSAHGAGRTLGRQSANRKLNIVDIKKELKQKDIYIMSKSDKGLIEEAPEAYKDIDEVINVSDELKLTEKIARLKPIAVIKG